MGVLAILRLLLTLASAVAGIVRDRQLLEAGKAEAIKEGLEKGLTLIAAANKAAAAVVNTKEAVADDTDNLDRKP